MKASNPADSTNDANPRKLIERNMADVPAESVDWLWPNQFALKHLSLIAGEPGAGKTTLVCDMAARVTRGLPWHDGSGNAPKGKVLIVNLEDHAGDTIRPRLDKHGADVSEVTFVRDVETAPGSGKTRLFNLGLDVELLAESLSRRPDTRLVFIDPIGAACGKIDNNSNTEVRSTVAPLALIAERFNVAIIMVSHLNKGESSAMQRVNGSVAWVAAPRAAFLLSKDPEQPSRRLFLPIKNNLGNDTYGFSFRIEEPDYRAEWEPGTVAKTADEVLIRPERRRGPAAVKESKATEFLRSVLTKGERLSSEIVELAIAAGIAKRTLDRAKECLEVVSDRKGVFGGPSYWRLPDSADRAPTPLELGEHGKDDPNAENVGSDHDAGPHLRQAA